jgi:hypothetical protein
VIVFHFNSPGELFVPPTNVQDKFQLWQERFQQFRQSQQTIQGFCQAMGCAPATFYYWKHKLVSLEQANASSKPVAASSFVPVVLRDTNAANPQSIVVRVKKGMRITLPVDALAALELILQHVCQGAE